MTAAEDTRAPETPSPTNVGGQAVIEGVMMRAPGSLSIVCRRADGSLVLRERSIASPSGLWAKTPLLRGMYTLVSSVRVGHQALLFSASLMEEDMAREEAEEEARKKGESQVRSAKKSPPSALSIAAQSIAAFLMSPVDPEGDALEKNTDLEGGDSKAAAKEESPRNAPKASSPAPKASSPAAKTAADFEEERQGSPLLAALPVLLAIGLFIAAPQLAAEGINSWLGLGLDVTSPGFQAITGASKLLIIVSYMSMLRFTEAGRRMFEYHGAEHKSISTYEAEKPLEVPHARGVSALHARCGTTFIIMVAFVSVVLFSVLGAFLPKVEAPRLVQSIVFFLTKLPFLPLVAGITFELQRFFARYCTTGPLRVLLWPGFLVQKITTAPPDDAQLEVALASLRSALANAKVSLPEEHPDRAFDSYSAMVADPAYRGA